MVSSSPTESDSIETGRPPAVSSLKSHFEQIANANSQIPSSKKLTVSGLGFPTSTSGLLTADRRVSPRQRTSSGDLRSQADDQDGELCPVVHLRSASSSSDLRSSKRPPPPPPTRSSKPASPSASPRLHLIPTSLPNPITSPTKRPPPPIPSSPTSKSDLPLPQAGNVASIRGKFPSNDTYQPQSVHPLSKAVNITHQQETTNGPQLWSEDNLLSPPPPLPVRKNGNSLAPDDNKPVTGGSPTTQIDPMQDPKSSRTVPPRPPPRSKNPVSLSQSASLFNPHTPPPLPARKVTSSVYEDILPSRTLALHISENITSSEPITESSPTVAERKLFGSLPPPPKRQIGLKDGLPEFKRHQQFSDSSDEEEEEESKTRIDLPDSSRSSRKPPYANFYPHSESHISVPHNGIYAVAGSIVAVVSSHAVKLFDLAVSESPLYALDLKDISPDRRSRKPTSLAFRNSHTHSEKATLLWIGTKDGHIFEVDIRSAVLVSSKIAAHAQAVTHIFSAGHMMVTMDDNGKALIFAPDDSQDFVLSSAQPRVVRVADKQDFVKLIAGRLWTSARESSSGTAGSSRGPIVRVYDIFTLGSSGRSLLPTEHVGTVTCGTMLPSNPGYVYLGHEGGTVTIWTLGGTQGAPECIDVVKVSMSDILCLAGVNDRLWGGSRAGHISAYDTLQKPWVMTNSWVAHKDVPVTQLSVDPWSITLVGKLCAVSVGRDERMRFWDGLLAVSWIDHELMAREDEYSSYRELSTLIVSWNVDANKPDALTGDPSNIDFLKEVLTSATSPDIISIGFQEVVDLENRKVTAKSVLLGNKTKANDGTMSQKVSTSYKKWYDHLVLSVRLAHPGTPYYLILSENLVGLFTCIFVKVSERASIKDTHLNVIKCGMRGNFGNKGAIVCRLIIDDSSLCFINCHLAAGQHQVRQRGRDVAAILEERALFPEQSHFDPSSCAFVNGGDGTMVLDHEIVFFSGDMNYRIEARREVVIASIRSGEHQDLQVHDQLLKEMRLNRGFRLRPFQEGPIDFIPTYKYDPRTNEFDTSPKKRIPAWCDRILWRVLNNSRTVQTQYRRWEANISDHRPISAAFGLTVKSINPASRANVKSDVEKEWAGLQQRLLSDLQRFYIDWGIL